jgi:predicted TPR repeat methyltransferase
MFAFTIASPTAEEQAASRGRSSGYVMQPTACGVSIYAHSDRYIREALHCIGFELLKTQKILTSSGEEVTDDLLFEVVVARNSRP